MFVVAVQFTVKPEYLGLFLEAVRKQARDSIEEKGCIRFDINQGLDDRGYVFLYEIYEDEEVFREHVSRDYFKEFSKTTSAWVRSKQVRELQLVESHT